MATVQLSDVQFDADVYLSYMQEDRPDRNAYVASGVATTNSQLSSRAAGDGDITSIPFWKDLATTNENIGSDDPLVLATPEKIGTGKMQARRVHVNNAWQTANLVSAVLGSEDPMRQIQSRTSAYWNDRFAQRVMATTIGVYNANVANNASDMVFQSAIEDGDNATDANKFNFEGFVDAVATMGESDDKLAAIGVHPLTLARMRKENNIEFIQDSETGLMIPFYNGKRVIVDKKMPVLAGGTSGSKYITVLYGAGAIGYGEALAPKAVEMDSNPLAGNGSGIETLVERKQWIIHPAGHKWTDTTVAADAGPTVAECQLAVNWERQFLRENVNMAFYVHN